MISSSVVTLEDVQTVIMQRVRHEIPLISFMLMTGFDYIVV